MFRAPGFVPVIRISAMMHIAACLLLAGGTFACAMPKPDGVSRVADGWRHLSSEKGDLPSPGPALEQTALQILDVDLDHDQDFVLFARGKAPAVIWFRRNGNGWERYTVDAAQLPIEAGAATFDVDRDGDPDIVAGEDDSGNHIYWWENPYPVYSASTGWTRHVIKDSGRNKHHDMMFGDFDGDGDTELVFWNQGASGLYIADIPTDPRNSGTWQIHRIYTSAYEAEGLASADMDGDGMEDIIGGGYWFKHKAANIFRPMEIDGNQQFTRAAAGQLVAGGRPEVVLVVGDGKGYIKWYEWRDDRWLGHDLLAVPVDHGHTLAIADMNNDGLLDIFNAEMRLNGGNPGAKARIFLGDGLGNFDERVVSTGFGHHQSRVADLDGDGDLDILGKPYNWETPRVDIYLNETFASENSVNRQWARHVIDVQKPWRSLFINAGDIDGDGDRDIVTGGWWYENPGEPGDSWTRHLIGEPVNNMALLDDLDHDGDLDILGTRGKGSEQNAQFAWAENDGTGTFAIHDNVQAGTGDFLQGVAADTFKGQGKQIALSWHDEDTGVQLLSVPPDPREGVWPIETISRETQAEALTPLDADSDGDDDILLGTKWLENTLTGWRIHRLADEDKPDRNRVVDMNSDGKPDAVVGFEAISVPGAVSWYENRLPFSPQWSRHDVARIIGPMSLDTGDLDGDGDVDIVAGEHNLKHPESARLYLFENLDGEGKIWSSHVIYTGDEHHDGAVLTDIDRDGDLDVISIGWDNPRVLLYENLGKQQHR